MRLFDAFGRQRCGWIFAEMIFVVAFFGLVDFLTGYEVSFFIFYGAPILVVAWYCDRKMAVLVALSSGLTWWWADWMSGHAYDYSWLQGWETFVRLGFFVFVAMAGAGLREHHAGIANRLALLEHSQRLEREIVGISEREQRRIGRDLHDGLCQYLAAVGCAAASLAGDLEKRELRKEASVANELAKFLQDAVVQARDLSHGLVPTPMGEAALALALENLAASVSRLQRVECTFESDGLPANCDEISTIHLYRIAQEAINNATRHGKAHKIDISLRANSDLMTLSIADNGVGISKTVPSNRGMGLSIMTYRARLSGGELRVEEPSRGGTMVSCLLNSATARST